jgi:hypothetical protein
LPIDVREDVTTVGLSVVVVSVFAAAGTVLFAPYVIAVALTDVVVVVPVPPFATGVMPKSIFAASILLYTGAALALVVLQSTV